MDSIFPTNSERGSRSRAEACAEACAEQTETAVWVQHRLFRVEGYEPGTNGGMETVQDRRV